MNQSPMPKGVESENLLEEIRRLEEQLADVQGEERAWFLQTGHHIGRRLFQQRCRELESDKRDLEERIQRLRRLLGP